MKYPQSVIMKTTLGEMEAIKERPSVPWHIHHPWGSDRIFGTVAQVKVFMKRVIKLNDE